MYPAYLSSLWLNASLCLSVCACGAYVCIVHGLPLGGNIPQVLSKQRQVDLTTMVILIFTPAFFRSFSVSPTSSLATVVTTASKPVCVFAPTFDPYYHHVGDHIHPYRRAHIMLYLLSLYVQEWPLRVSMRWSSICYPLLRWSMRNLTESPMGTAVTIEY